MPDSMEKNIEVLLKGLPLEGEEAELCDFTLEDFNAALETQGIQASVNPNFKPILKETVTYVVAVVVFNRNKHVLMMQEAKPNCAGKWYLPAGRVNKSERIKEAAEREVLEETGLIVDCKSLLMVECAWGAWVRFTLYADEVGGTLKTPAEADQESLQAKWAEDLNELTLRSNDIVQLIDRARLYVTARENNDKTWHEDLLPAIRPHKKLLLRLVVVIKKRATNRVHVLLSERNAWHLPACEIHPNKSLHTTLRKFMVDLFGAEVPAHKPHGLLSVEYDPAGGDDGLCLTMLISFRHALEEVPIIGKCVWHETSKELGEKLLMTVASKNSTIVVHVI